MTERLYYTDATCARFSARVVEQTTWEGHAAVVLDRTAFYPTSGGQPADRGTLDGVNVLDVVAREGDGAIVHVLSEGLSGFEKPDGSTVEGVIDWQRRFDHMQQHTGQHILSAAFEQMLEADTVGFHMGAEVSTIDLNVSRLEPAAVTPVEELANQIVWEDRPVHTRFVSADELATLSLRHPPTVEEAVRIVEVTAPSTGSGLSFDVNPCGGTHVARTGEIGLIKIVRLDYRGDETRVEFLCGGRALHDYRAKNAMTNQLATMLTVGHWELDQAVERLQAEAKQLRQEMRRARKQLLTVEVNELAETAIVREPHCVVWKVWEPPGKPPGELRALAQELAQHPSMVALLVSVGERTDLCFARAEDADPDVAALLREACTQLGGKGGGRPNLAQGSAPATDAAHARTVLTNLLSSLGLHTA
jgi:alanyl-tRNA synthetase